MKQTVESIMKSFRNSEKKHLIITGTKGIGKTTRLEEIIKELSVENTLLPGITTYLIPRSCVMLRENGTTNEQKIGIASNGMQPVEKGFAELGIPALNRVVECDSEWVSIDELGFLESENLPFQKAVREVFEKKRVVAILRKQDIPFLNDLKKREDVFVIDLDDVKSKTGCIIMASGLSTRFGSNKLLEKFDGVTLIQRILNTTSGSLFDRRVVVTRTPEVAEICNKQGIDVILHTLPGRNDAVRLGVEGMLEMDGLVFCPCDQPLLRRESLEAMMNYPYVHDNLILRLAFEERVGTPIFFGKKYMKELCNLPEKKGGSYLAKKYPEKVKYVYVEDERELMDVDIPEDLEKLLE